MSKRKRQTGPDVHTRIRQTPAECILAQQARRSEVNAGNQEEDHHRNQQLGPGPAQQPRTPWINSNQHGQQPHLAPTRQADNHQAQRRAQEASRSIDTDASGSKDLGGRHHAEPRTVPVEQLETFVDGEGTGHVEGDNEDGLDIEEEQDHTCHRKAQPPLRLSLTVQTNAPQAPVLQNSQPAPAAKRRVGLAFSYFDCVLKLL